MVEHLPRKHEALNIPGLPKENKCKKNPKTPKHKRNNYKFKQNNYRVT
jgi:hypothetical protein